MKTRRSLDAELLYLLKEWSPAVASFPWDFADKSAKAMSALKSKYAGKSVQPLTAYDNGNALYHSSIVDAIIPFVFTIALSVYVLFC
jgi:hypothetical protein